MSIKKKTILATVSVLTVLIITLSLVIWLIVRQTFSNVERLQAKESAKHGMSVITNTMNDMDKKIYDWAVWDDCYNFVKDKNEDFVSSNLGSDSIKAIGFDFMLFYDNDGKLVKSVCVDVVSGKESAYPDDVKKSIESNNRVMTNKSVDDRFQGIISSKKGPIIFAKHPITMSSGGEPIGGTLIVACYLSETLVDSLSKKYLLDLSVKSVNDELESSDIIQAKKQLSGSKEKQTVILNSSKKISGYGIMNDLEDKPAIIVKVQSDRDVYAQSLIMMRFTIIGILITGLLFGLLNLYWINRTIIKPVTNLCKYMETVRAELGI